MKITWRLRQLLPLAYHTVYYDASNQVHYCKWRMWFGRCFDIRDRVVGMGL